MLISSESSISLRFQSIADNERPNNIQWPIHVQCYRGSSAKHEPASAQPILITLLQLYGWPGAPAGQDLISGPKSQFDKWVKKEELTDFIIPHKTSGWIWNGGSLGAKVADVELTSQIARDLLFEKHAEVDVADADKSLVEFLECFEWYLALLHLDTKLRLSNDCELLQPERLDASPFPEYSCQLISLRNAILAARRVDLQSLSHIAKTQNAGDAISVYASKKAKLQKIQIQYRRQENVDEIDKLSPWVANDYPSLHLMSKHLECLAAELMNQIKMQISAGSKRPNTMLQREPNIKRKRQAMIIHLMRSVSYALVSMNPDEEIPQLFLTLEMCSEVLFISGYQPEAPSNSQPNLPSKSELSNMLLQFSIGLTRLCNELSIKLASADVARMLHVARRAAVWALDEPPSNFELPQQLVRALNIDLARVADTIGTGAPSRGFAASYLAACAICDMLVDETSWPVRVLEELKTGSDNVSKRYLRHASLIGEKRGTDESKTISKIAKGLMSSKKP